MTRRTPGDRSKRATPDLKKGNPRAKTLTVLISRGRATDHANPHAFRSKNPWDGALNFWEGDRCPEGGPLSDPVFRRRGLAFSPL